MQIRPPTHLITQIIMQIMSATFGASSLLTGTGVVYDNRTMIIVLIAAGMVYHQWSSRFVTLLSDYYQHYYYCLEHLA